MTDIQVLSNRLAGSAYRSAPVPIEPRMPQGWCREHGRHGEVAGVRIVACYLPFTSRAEHAA